MQVIIIIFPNLTKVFYCERVPNIRHLQVIMTETYDYHVKCIKMLLNILIGHESQRGMLNNSQVIIKAELRIMNIFYTILLG